MNRPWLTWSLFGLCLAVVLAAMGWTTLTVMRLEDTSRKQEVREENVRLALWRMDSALAPLLAQEAAVPYFAYGAFYPAGRSYAEMFNSARAGEAVLASPLLTRGSPHAQLYFQFDADGKISSPQVPTLNRMRLAQQTCTTAEQMTESATKMLHLQSLVTREQIMETLPPESIADKSPVQYILNSDNAGNAFQGLNYVNNVANNLEPAGENQIFATNAQQQDTDSLRNNKQSKSSAEWQKRDQSVKEASQGYGTAITLNNGNPQNRRMQQQQMEQLPMPMPMEQSQAPAQAKDAKPKLADVNCTPTRDSIDTKATADVTQGMLLPVWVGSELLLARRVAVGGRMYVQGCWVDWNWLQGRLLSDIRDLLPDARLEAVASADPERAPNRLAALPVKLNPGNTIPLDAPEGISPVRISLLIAWGCALLAAGAVASLLFGAVSLSERRGAFVSAVTHELRTPLTTFRMYAEMLASGMVPTREAQQSYLNTLSAEAGRLSHLVENVLSYARLERGSARSQVEHVTAADLIGKIQPRLNERAAQAGMTVTVNGDAQALEKSVTTDVTAVEQILFNLVDNACKYASHGTDKTIEVIVAQKGSQLSLKVCDKGPGFTRQEARKLFRPFSKSAREAAHSAPGVGLGLALSRRLARDLKGDLQLRSRPGEGACFELTLPEK